MLSLHSTTLLQSLVAVTLCTGTLLLISSRQNRSETSLFYWGVANLVGSAGLVLLGLRGVASDRLSIDAANAMLFLSYMLNWAGMRRFCNRSIVWPCMAAPSIVWLALCQWPAFYASVEWRVAVNSAMMGLIALASAGTLWNLKGERLVSRFPAVAWLMIHASIFLVRIPFALSTPVPPGHQIMASPSMTLMLFEALFHASIMSFLQLSMAKDRAENRYRMAAETDVLTGLPNRRAFFERAERAVAAATAGGRPAAVLVIDIDRFKTINDTFGHAGGDRVLVAVAAVIRAHLRPDDAFGRLGGEEFGCLLADTSPTSAFVVAEGLRHRIAGLDIPGGSDGRPIRVSASIGVSALDSRAISLSQLLDEADAGLYEAKRRGRDRVMAADGGLRRAS
ncbi:GGDEF domain-containing protein [Phreatobacter stygius]|uniref:diguanylate cyclase n=1 Tax=Phreatobacter stygius TaxID=1940610 RepID=A0A4D7AP63_9HYPH|nr:GGDEF domain-containing protein [Phreatobacter stygius]QCI62964.1 GGDEF domain-containing protein [Phreatobacter stygius]